MITEDHKRRVRKELHDVGLSRYSLSKNESRHLPNIIHEDEHIEAAINGRSDTGSVMLVATDKRLLYLDCKSFYSSTDEITYDVVSGVLHHVQGIFSNVIVHTRVGEYNLRFVNNKEAKRFVSFLESKRLELPDYRIGGQQAIDGPNMAKPTSPFVLENDARQFLQTHSVGVLSTIDRTGNVSGATVYYLSDADGQIYILTKTNTNKSRNMLVHKQVAFTVFEEYSLESIQVSGVAEVVSDQSISNRVYSHITQERQYGDTKSLPPVSKIQTGSFIVFRIDPTEAKYQKFK